MNSERMRNQMTDNDVERLLQEAPPPVDPAEGVEEAVWLKMADHLGRKRRQGPGWFRGGGGFRRVTGLGTAAAALILAILAGYARLAPGGEVRTAPIEITGPSVRIYRLAEGSILEAYPGSRVAWSLGEESRDLYLYRGEVFLDVKPDGREFRVLTPSATVSVLGTRFRVRVSPVQGEGEQP
jgi:ferric-dicitrate binding protein FerR (iron transport regulator)